MQPGKFHGGARGGFWIGRRHRIGAEIEGFAGMTQTDLGFAREIHRQIGGSAKEIGKKQTHRLTRSLRSLVVRCLTATAPIQLGRILPEVKERRPTGKATEMARLKLQRRSRMT